VVAAYLLRRSVVSIVVLAGISVVLFFMLHLAYPSPGFDVLGLGARPVQVSAWNRDHGFTEPVIVQYWHYVDRLLHGDLGYSFKLNQDIARLFEERWARSLYLSGSSLLLALLVVIPLGILQAVRRHRLGDRVATGLEFALYAMPDYLLYLLAIQVLAFAWPVFGYQASQSTSLPAVIADWRSMTLPIACSAVLIVAGFSRYFRSAAIDTLGQDYIKVARAKGLPERLVLSRHLLRNACLPMITLTGLSIPALLAGNLIVETVFNYEGLGMLFNRSLQDTDYFVLLAYTQAGAILTVLGNFLADIALMAADPRLRVAPPSH
jgi:peptide/nickel transport system permease protein